MDFADAAGEWGSIVHVPREESKRMLELADQRRIADPERRQGVEERPILNVARPNLGRYV